MFMPNTKLFSQSLLLIFDGQDSHLKNKSYRLGHREQHTPFMSFQSFSSTFLALRCLCIQTRQATVKTTGMGTK